MISRITLCCLLGASLSAHAAQKLFPNGDFEESAGAQWGVAPATGNFSFPASGGNPNGYAEMGSIQGDYAVLISNNDAPYPLASLGLVAGNTYTFTYDMKASVAGPNKGGIKVESWSATAPIHDSGNQRVTAASTGWATYSYDYKIAATATHIKLVPLWTPNETVGFDNIKVNDTPVVPPPVVPDQIPNGDFSIANGSNWTIETTGPAVTYPGSGGNPNGNAIIDATVTEGFAAIEAFSGAEKTWTSLGLAPGDTFFIQMDMKILEGSGIGGVRLVGGAGFEAPAIPFQRPTIIGDGTTWETYSIPITVPASPAQAKFTFLWGFNSKVAFDNIKIVLPAPAGPLQASITTGTAVSWTAASAVNRYQPQESSDGTSWTNLGPAIIGNTANSIFDDSKSPFYQVLESVPVMQEAAYNGNFALKGFDDDEADGWNPDQSQWPLRLVTGGRTDNGACMQLKVFNAAALPNGSEISQNTNNVLDNETGEIVPGNSYTLSFWAKQISVSDGYVQECRVTFLTESGAELPPGGGMWQNFSAPVGGDWVQKTLTGLVAPAGAVSALIQIVGKTGAQAGGFGEVLIDDVSLLSAGFAAPNVPALTASAVPTAEISWQSKTGQDYQVQSSTNLSDWSNLGGVIPGDSSIKAAYDNMAAPNKFYRVGELP